MFEKQIIIVDDEEAIRELVADILEKENFKVIKCADTDDGYKKILKIKPDLIILDVKMPQVGGIELCRLVRANIETKNIPVIMLTVESTEVDKVIGLEVGADDYITKPFSNKEFVARIKALLRRVIRKIETKIFEVDGLVINLDSMSVSIKGKEIKLRPKEFDLLYMFLSKPNIVLSREYILEEVFGYSIEVTTRTIDTHIKNLRQALGIWGNKIVTIFGRGFKLVANNHDNKTI